MITYNDAQQSVGLLWMNDQSVAETSTWQHTTLTTHKHQALGRIRTHDRGRRAAVDLCLRPRGHWDRHHWALKCWNKLGLSRMIPLAHHWSIRRVGLNPGSSRPVRFFGKATFIFSKQGGYGSFHTPGQLAPELLSIYIFYSLQKERNIVAQIFQRNW